MDYKVIVNESHSIENGGIGPYEYWGQKCIDSGENYIRGYIDIVFKDYEWNKENEKLFNDLYDNDVEEFVDFIDGHFEDNVVGDEQYSKDLNCIREKYGRVGLCFEYESSGARV